jgi:prevent-host-death family protein
VNTIPQKELRNQVGEVLRRVEAGETLLVTVAGRPVAELSPASRRRWLTGDAMATVWHGPAPHTLADDLQQLPAALTDPFSP